MVRQPKVGVEGVHIVTAKRAGKPVRHYIYAWRGGPHIRSVVGGEKPTITREDIAAIAAAIEETKPAPKDTIEGLIRQYRPHSPEWARLEISTQATWGRALDRIAAKWGAVPLRLWNDPRMVTEVMKWRDEMVSTPRAADTHIGMLHRLLEFGRLRGKIGVNVASRIPTLYRAAQRAEIVWTSDDFHAFNEKANQSLRDVAALAAMTGLRRADLIGLTWNEIGARVIRRVAEKKSRGKRRTVVMPVLPTLNDLLDELRTRPRKIGSDTVLVTSHGTAWTANGLSGGFGSAVREAGIYHIDHDGQRRWKHLHDIRGTFATTLMTTPDLNLNDREIAKLMGWSPEQVSEIRTHYVDDTAIVVALGERLARNAVKRVVKH